MDSVIRATDPELSSSETSDWGWRLLIFCLAILVLASFVFAVLQANIIGWTGLAFLGGVGAVALIGALGVLTSKRLSASPDHYVSGHDSIYSHAFFESKEPMLLVRSGKPIYANNAYFELAKYFGVESFGDVPPAVDRLFSSTGEDVTSAIFRLYHMEAGWKAAEETIDYLTPIGGLRRYRLSVTRLEGSDTDYLWQVSDITQNEAAIDEIMTRAPVGLFSVTKAGKILTMNVILERWLGHEGEPRPETMKDFIENPESLLNSTASKGRIVRTDTRLITRKGVVTPTVMVGQWDIIDSGELVCHVALYGHSSLSSSQKDTPQKAGVTSSSMSQPAGFAAAPVGMLELTLESDESPLSEAKILSANPAFERMSAGAGIKNKRLADIFKDDGGDRWFLERRADQCNPDKPFDAVLNGENSLPVSVYILTNTGAEDPLNLEGNSKTIWAFLVDVSARKSLEDQLIQSQKMQAIGQLAAGVAHDFNNLLTAIRLNTDELLQRHPVGDPSYPELQNINATGARAGALVKKLLAFSRKQTRRMEVLSVTDTLSDMVVTLRQTLGEKAKLVMVHGRNLPPVMADKSQIDTVLDESLCQCPGCYVRTRWWDDHSKEF